MRQLDNLLGKGHAQFLLSLCGQMWAGKEGVHLYSLRIQSAELQNFIVQPVLTARGWPIWQEPASSDVAMVQVTGLDV